MTRRPNAPQPGYQADAAQRGSVYLWGAALTLAAVLCAAPGVLNIAVSLRGESSPGPAPWAYGLVLLGFIQAAYAVYLTQLPDWSSLWVVSLAASLLAAVFAMCLAVALWSDAEGNWLRAWGLADPWRRRQAAGWCFLMLSLNSLLGYGCGRAAATWRRALHQTGESEPEQNHS